MPPAKLLAMANQIAGFFRSYPRGEAVAGVQAHLRAFWTPGMIATLHAHLLEGGAGADPLVAEAFSHAARADNPVDRVTSSPVREAGQMASDAG